MKHIWPLLLILPSLVWAQDESLTRPKVSVELAQPEVIVGQPVILRMKVLVPTFMPNPPVFPSLEQEDLLVRLPERAAGPVSETIEGQTWSGVQRSYRLYPLSPGQISFEAAEISVTYADAETNAPVQTSVPVPAIALNAIVPEGARDLDPLIIASGFTLEQEVSGPTAMQTGDAVARRITANISGTSPILIPRLIPETDTPLLRAYPKEPSVTETEDRGILSGQRVDEVTYLAQDGGQVQLPALSVRWYNLNSNQVETAEVAASDLTISVPLSQRITLENPLAFAVGIGFAILALWAVRRWGLPQYQSWRKDRADRYLVSQEYALAQPKSALKQRDLSGSYSALDLWKSRCAATRPAKPLEAELAKIGASRYGNDTSDLAPDWSTALKAADALGAIGRKDQNALPPLNP